MKTLSIASLLAIAAAFTCTSASASDPSAGALRLQTLRQDKDFESGCGCSVGAGRGANYKTLIFSGVEERAAALVKVDGTLRSLNWISSNEKTRAPRVGDRFTKVYSDGQLRLT
ncbi:MAG: hypothetical protein EOP11_26750, partial [Proteobacteria bacterium]